jgi:sulfopyruvate decarboxylase subunit alpha
MASAKQAIQSSLLLKCLEEEGFSYVAGVPDSIFISLIARLEQSPSFTYVPATREDIAVGLAAGAYLTGKKAAVLMENSGIGTSLDALTSLVGVYELPLLLLIAWAGYKGTDEPHHNAMGLFMCRILSALNVKYFILPEIPSRVPKIVHTCVSHMDCTNQAVAILIRPGSLL